MDVSKVICNNGSGAGNWLNSYKILLNNPAYSSVYKVNQKGNYAE